MKPYTAAAVEQELRAAMREQDWRRVAVLERQIDIIDQPRPPATLAAAALWYAQQGVPVFPIQPGLKTPHRGTRGVLDATTDEDTIRAWWGRSSDSNIGLATGYRFDVIDFDGPHSHAAWTRALGASWGDADVTVLATVSTPRAGGLHVYVPATGEGNAAGLADGVDYRGRGGYVLAPPSRTPAGVYLFLRPLKDTAS